MASVIPPAVSGLGSIVSRYDLVLCDLWGVMHDGVHAFPGANEACAQARAAGAAVIMISNAPRPGHVVGEQIARYGVPKAAYDDIVSSGDVTRDELLARPGAKVFHLGPERDLPNYQGLNVTLEDFDTADLIVCTGPFNDETDKPEDYRELLARAKARGLVLLCANPDIVVERGHKLIWCAGAIAAIYDAIGGETVYAGKPYPPIYRIALSRAAKLRGKEIEPKRVLAVGDSVKTDILGARRQGFDALFIARGIHAAEGGRLAQIYSEIGATPTGVMHEFVW